MGLSDSVNNCSIHVINNIYYSGKLNFPWRISRFTLPMNELMFLMSFSSSGNSFQSLIDLIKNEFSYLTLSSHTYPKYN